MVKKITVVKLLYAGKQVLKIMHTCTSARTRTSEISSWEPVFLMSRSTHFCASKALCSSDFLLNSLSLGIFTTCLSRSMSSFFWRTWRMCLAFSVCKQRQPFTPLSLSQTYRQSHRHTYIYYTILTHTHILTLAHTHTHSLTLTHNTHNTYKLRITKPKFLL